MTYGPPKGPPSDFSPDHEWQAVKSNIDSRVDSLFPDSGTFLPKVRYSDLEVMAIFARLADWEEHGNEVPIVVLHMRAIVKNHRWVLVD